jgi:hypothetical protein
LNSRALPFLALGLSALLCACVDLEAGASIGAAGSGTLSIKYTVSRMVSPLAALGSESELPFPLSRAEYERAVANSPGLSLVSYSSSESEDDLSVTSSIAFASVAVLASFLDPTGKRAIYSEEGGQRRLQLLLSTGSAKREALLDPDMSKLFEAAFSKYQLSFKVDLPSPAISANGGTITGRGVRVEYSIRTEALVKSEEPVIWEIVW